MSTGFQSSPGSGLTTPGRRGGGRLSLLGSDSRSQYSYQQDYSKMDETLTGGGIIIAQYATVCAGFTVNAFIFVQEETCLTETVLTRMITITTIILRTTIMHQPQGLSFILLSCQCRIKCNDI